MEKEPKLNASLPDLADLSFFGYEKTKFTEALKKLQQYFNDVIKNNKLSIWKI